MAWWQFKFKFSDIRCRFDSIADFKQGLLAWMLIVATQNFKSSVLSILIVVSS